MTLVWSCFWFMASLLTLALLVHGQPGFLSIDCGIPDGLNYTDDTTKMVYTSDAKYIDTGINQEISAATYMTQKDVPQQYRNLRNFPDGIRNCYTLTPVNKSSRYLLGASFMYGDYDGLNKPPQFDVYVGVNLWYVNLPSTVYDYRKNEIIFYATTDYISICLVNIGHGFPYISTLELRPLDNSIYQAANESQLLQLYSRLHFRPSGRIRFPDDAYDRVWYPWGENHYWTLINTSSPINLKEDNGYQPPLSVMNTAVIPSKSTENFSFYFPTSNLNESFQYQIFMHFAELEQLRSNEFRQFNVFIDGVLAHPHFSPVYLSADTITIYSALNGLQKHVIDFWKTTTSTLPPILNAVEVYSLQPLSAPHTDSRDVDAIMNIKTRYNIRKNWMGDPCLPASFLWEGLNCNYTHSKPPTIISLDLSSSGLTGEVSPLLSNLTSLQLLDVSNNRLTGPVPDFLTELTSLKFLNFSNNNLTGTIPPVLQERSNNGSLSLSFDNNPHLVGSSIVTVNNYITPCEGGSCKKRRKIVVSVLASVIPAMLVILAIAVFVLQRRRRRVLIVEANRTSDLQLSENGRLTITEDPVVEAITTGGLSHSETQWFTAAEEPVVEANGTGSSLLSESQWFTSVEDPVVDASNMVGSLSPENRQYTYAEVADITKNFERFIGRGGFGMVYHGQKSDGTELAVKMLSPQSAKLLSEVSKQFQTEARLLMKVHHRNLVQFKGYCQEGEKMALIYEYMAQGDLKNHLLDPNSEQKALNWGQRLRIALDVARGLEYLHNDCVPPIIHRDIKTTNILLNERLEAKIGDFGLSKVFLMDDEQSHISTLVKGTPGYFDPEYRATKHLTKKSDVYSFGVVLLQLITGKPAIIQRGSNDSQKMDLVDWASPIIARGDIQALVDSRLEGDYSTSSLTKAVETAQACTSAISKERPTMSDVVAKLKDCR